MKRLIISLFVVSCGLFILGPQLSFAAGTPSAVYQNDKKDVKKKTETVTFKTSMTCKNCVKKIEGNIPFEKGVRDLKVSLEDKLVTITYDPSKTDEETLCKAIEKLGYTAEKVTS